MKTRICILIFILNLFLCVRNSSAQNWQWFNQIGSPGTSQFFPDEFIEDMAVDADGNVYVCGHTFAGALFNGTPLPGYGDQDGFVAKFNCAGQMVWYHSVGSANIDWEYLNHIELSKSGRIYLSGYVLSSNTSPATVIDTTFSTQSGENILLCLDTAGNRKWIKFNGGGGAQCIATTRAMGIDKYDNIYVTGGNYNNCQVYPNLSTPGANLYLAKLDSNGNALWYKVMDTLDVRFAVDAEGNCYYAGTLYSPTTINGQLVSPIGATDIIVVKYDSAGNYQY